MNADPIGLVASHSDNYSQVLHKPLHSHTDILDLPPSLRTSKPASNPSFSPATHLTASSRTPTVNRFKVNAGQSLQDWEKSGWIWEGDPRGWAQWYVRFCEGRRCEDDERQVQRCEWRFYSAMRLGPYLGRDRLGLLHHDTHVVRFLRRAQPRRSQWSILQSASQENR